MGVPALDIAAGLAALLLFGFVVWSIARVGDRPDPWQSDDRRPL